MVGSFKLRLVLYFILLSLVPLGGVTWAFTEAAGQTEFQRADAALTRWISAADGSLSLLLDRAQVTAASLARMPRVQRALLERDSGRLAGIATGAENATFLVAGRRLAGSVPPLAISRSATVLDGSEVLGKVVVHVPLDSATLATLSEQAGLGAGELFAIATDGRIKVASKPLVGASIPAATDEAVDLAAGGTDYRALADEIVADSGPVSLLALMPRSSIESTRAEVETRLLLAGLGSMAFVAAVALLAGRAIVAVLRNLRRAASGIAQGRLSERVPVRGRDEFAKLGRAFNDMAAQLEARHAELVSERERVQRAVARLGAALAAGNEPSALLQVVAESVVEATEAGAAAVRQARTEVARAGEPGASEDPVSIPLGHGEATLMLYPVPGSAFTEEALAAARSLAAQAAVALENARLHRILAQQAVTDDLTQLANRRRFEDALAFEVSRVQRFGGSLALLVADLDDFKAVNDRFGHQLGDEVLRLFADVIRETVRVVDLPARPGGEEFAVILPGTELDEACVLAERIRSALADRRVVTPEGRSLAVTASFGVAGFAEMLSATELVGAADAALYEAKAAGKNRVVRSRGGVGEPVA
jgi:diguanylate cyclase (GGDEF)-like protein